MTIFTIILCIYILVAYGIISSLCIWAYVKDSEMNTILDRFGMVVTVLLSPVILPLLVIIWIICVK